MANFLTQQAKPRASTIISLIALLVFMPLLLLGVYETTVLITRARGVPAKIIIRTKAIQEPINTEFYHAFAQGGEEAGDMLGPILPQLKALKPRVIRLDHIYDHYDVVHKSGDNISYNFAELDKAVNTIVAAGARPVLALSYMPPSISRDGSLISPPSNWNDWAQVVQRTVEHYSGKNEKNLNGVYYEVWNEPDLAQFGSWKYGGSDKNYMTLYQYSSIGARNANNVNQFYLGGPSTTGLYKSWILALVRSGNRVDFVSWHTYQADPTRYAQDQRNLVSWLLPYPRFILIPKLITEFGFTGDKSTGYGTTYASAHAAAVVRQLIVGGPTYAFSFQPKDGPGQESGNGWGLITHETNGKKQKPRYFIYNFLDEMAGNRLEVSGEGSWVTSFATFRDGTIRVLLVNFDPRGSHVENVPVTFDELDPGTYIYREHFLFGRDVKLNETVTSNTLTKQVYMAAQSVGILELKKQ